MLQGALKNFKNIRVAVIGDVMLDSYIYGRQVRLNPESSAPLLTVLHGKGQQSLGGAGNVALNAKTLGARVDLFSIIGRDTVGLSLQKLARLSGIGFYPLYQGETVVKERFVDDDHGHSLLRVDHGEHSTGALSAENKKKLLGMLRKKIARYDALIFSDYNKFLFRGRCVEEIIALAKKHGVKTFVDPKPANAFRFKGAYLIRPNLKEARLILEENTSAEALVLKLQQKLKSEHTVITCGSEGMCISGEKPERIFATVREVRDVSGAGDTVIVCLALATLSGCSLKEAADIASVGAGIVVSKRGTAPLLFEELWAEFH